MAIAVTLLATNRSTANTTSYADAESTQPAANSKLLWFIASTGTSPAAPNSTSAYGLTWSQLATQTLTTAGRITCFEADAGASPTSTAATCGFAASMTGCQFDICEIVGATTGDFTVQQPTNTGSSQTTATVTFAALADGTNNAEIMCTFVNVNEAMTPDASGGWTELSDAGVNSPAVRMQTQWRTGSDLTATATWTTSATWAAIGVEVQVAPPSLFVPRRRQIHVPVRRPYSRHQQPVFRG